MIKELKNYLFIHSPITRIALFALFLLAGGFSAEGQDLFNRGRFGKNRVQYKQFNWQFITTRNFEIYFYDEGRKKAEIAAEFAEADYPRIVDLVGFSPYNRIRLFIYNSITDLQQSNIGVSYQGFAVGGQTRFVRSEVEVPFTGNMSDFKSEISRGIADILIFEMMYGGNLKEVLQSNFLLRLPQWFMAGAARYIAEGWTANMDDYVREMLTSKKIKKPSRLEGEEAAVVGQSIWNFVAQEYGSSNVASVLNLTRIVRNEKSSIQNTLGIPYKLFIEKWKDYYLQQLAVVADDYYSVPDEKRLIKNRKNVYYNKVKISPDEKFLAYTENRLGRYKVKVREISSGKTKTVLKGGYRLINQRFDTDVPLIDWDSDTSLVIVAPREGKYHVWQRNLNEKWFWNQPKRKLIDPFDQIENFSVSPDGRTLLISAERRGQSDIYLYRLQTGSIRQMTNDPYDDLDPVFLPDGKRFVFSSNRNTDSVLVKEPLPKEELDYFNLWVQDPEVLTTYKQITKENSKNHLPWVSEKGDIFYLGESRGITQLFKFDYQDSTISQMTSFLVGIQDYDLNENGKLASVMINKGEDHVFYLDGNSVSPVQSTQKTVRQQKIDLQILRDLKRKELELADQKIQEEKEKQQDEQKEETPPVELQEGEIDTDNYQFDTFSKDRRQSFLERFKSKVKNKGENDKSLILTRPVPYESRFTIDNFVSSTLIDPLRNFGLLFEVSLTDVLENHKINAGLFGLTNLANNNFYAEYQYLKHRVDFSAKYERHNLEAQDEQFFLKKFNMDYVELGASYPINITTRFTVSPFFAHTKFTNFDIITTNQPDSTIAYGGFNAEFVYDNSVVTGVNQREGTRLKVRLEKFMGLDDSQLSFNNFSIDARNYLKIHRSLVFATRLSYGVFFGNEPKKYSLGGQNNWLFQNINREGADNPLFIDNDNANAALSSILFSRFITPLRGFDMNYLYGTNHLLLNGEIRLPFVQYLYRGTINSTFLRHLMFTGFMDIGTAWTGAHPFQSRNALNTEVVTDGEFEVTIFDFSDPFLIGYGFGFRTTMLGHYVRFDTAWGVEDRIRRGPRFYLAIGYDF